ncbi:MAG: aldo/keto reductase [Verrucomicrobiaceae bacterium]|nr:aldo/keto reductase [Verrucomicrobiaceae bacterium]
MRYRTYKNTDLRVSEVGFGLWTISTGWWGQFTEGEAIALMHKALDLGVTLFDAADTYGNGLSEELIAKAFPSQRDEVVIATKVGYDFVTHGDSRGRGQREIPQDFSPDAIVRATEAALKRLKTDRIDLLQLHNVRMEQVYDDAVWTTLEKLQANGKIRYYGIALGPAVGWLYEGVNCIRERNVTSVQHELAAEWREENRSAAVPGEFRAHAGPGRVAMAARGRTGRLDPAEHLRRSAADRIRQSYRMFAAHERRHGEDRRALRRELRRGTRGAEVQGNDGIGGNRSGRRLITGRRFLRVIPRLA